MPHNNWNKRMMTKNVEKLRKKKEHLVLTKVDVEEIMDLTGEVLEDTIIKMRFEDAIIINISVATALKLHFNLGELLHKYKKQ